MSSKTDAEVVTKIRDEWRNYRDQYLVVADRHMHSDPPSYGGAALYADRAKEADAGVRAVEQVMDELGIPK